MNADRRLKPSRFVFAGALLLAAGVAYRFLPLQRCPLHEVSMLRAPLRITYGLAESQAKPCWLFPNARSRALGGCVVSLTSLPFTNARHCPRCRQLESDWNAAHPNGLPPEQRRATRQQFRRWLRQNGHLMVR